MTIVPQLQTDEELMVSVQQGNRVALSSLYERYANRIYGMALQKLTNSAEAADVTHDIFVNLWQRSSTFQPARGSLRSWLLTVAHNQIVDTLRRIRRAREAYEAIARDPVAVSEVSHEDTAASAERNVEAQLVRQAL
jgi:RNA polymerase sigma-70 factor (ECF subfamily)